MKWGYFSYVFLLRASPARDRPCEEDGSGGALGETPNGLDAVQSWPSATDNVKTIFSRSNNAKCGQPPGDFNRRLAFEPLNLFSQRVGYNRPFQFQKRSPLSFSSHNETLSVVALC